MDNLSANAVSGCPSIPLAEVGGGERRIHLRGPVIISTNCVKKGKDYFSGQLVAPRSAPSSAICLRSGSI